MFEFLRKTPTVVGLDISSTAVKLLELSQDKGQYRVESYGVEVIPENAIVEKNIADIDAVGGAIKRVRQKSKTKVKEVGVAVAGSSVITKTLELAASLSEAQIEEQLLDDADKYIPYPLDEVAMDFQVRRDHDPEGELVDVLLAACRRENIESREEALELGGFKPEVIDIEAHCVQRAMQLIDASDIDEHGEDEVVAIVDIGATMTTLSVLTGTDLPYTREQMFGGRQLTEEIQKRYNLSFAEAGVAKKTGDLPEDYESEVLMPFKESLVQQVMRSLQFFYSSSRFNDVDRIVLAGGVASTPGLTSLISSRIGTPCQVANPFQGMTISERVNESALLSDGPALMIACGLAMRGLNR